MLIENNNVIYVTAQFLTNGEMKCFLGKSGVKKEIIGETDYCLFLHEAEDVIQNLPQDKRIIVYPTVTEDRMFIINSTNIMKTYSVSEEIADKAIKAVFDTIAEDNENYIIGPNENGDASEWVSLIECKEMIENAIKELMGNNVL